MKTTKVVLVIICILEIMFTVSCFLWPERVSQTLVTYWHITFVAELFACAGIKVAKVRKTYIDDDEDEDAVG